MFAALANVGSWLASAGSSAASWLSNGTNLAGLGNVLGGFGSAIGSLVNKSKGVSAAKAYFYQQMAAKQDYKRNMQALREAPTAQREGLESAGLNPVLYMANGSASYPTSSSSGGVQSSIGERGDLEGGFAGLGRAFNALSTLANVKEELKAKQIANENAPEYNKAQNNLLDKQAKAADKQAALYEAEAKALGLGGKSGGVTVGKKGVEINPLYFYRGMKALGSEIGSDVYDLSMMTGSTAKAFYDAMKSSVHSNVAEYRFNHRFDKPKNVRKLKYPRHDPRNSPSFIK